MDSESKLTAAIKSTAVAIVCAGLTFWAIKYKQKKRSAAEALTYLTIKSITTEDVCSQVVKELRRRIQKHKAVGFDCEWVTIQGKRQAVALVQLSSFDGYCGLFRLSHLKTIPQSLKELLEDETIYKVGVAPLDDAKYLSMDYSVLIRSTLDLRNIVELFEYTPGGLASLAKSHLNIILDKSWRVRCSNWEADELTTTQTNYAAADAHVAIKIFVNVINDHYGPYWKWLNIINHNNNIWNNIDDICWKYADVGFKSKLNADPDRESKKKPKNGKSEKEISKRYPFALRSKPLYHNCFLIAPDGELLCTCDIKKAEWEMMKIKI